MLKVIQKFVNVRIGLLRLKQPSLTMEIVDEHLSIQRLSWEADHEWEARKSFLESNKDHYTGDRLASLSLAWANWKFMGCNYGDAVQAVLEDCNRRLPPEIEENINRLLQAATSTVKFVKASTNESLGTRTGPPQGGGKYATRNLASSPPTKRKSFPLETVKEFILYVPSRNVLDTIDFNIIGCLYSSCQKSGRTIEFVESYEQRFVKYTVFINNTEISHGLSENKKEAKRTCAANAFEILRKKHKIVFQDEINHEHVNVIEKKNLVKSAYISAPKLAESNVGNKLLRKMGWDGSSGVGKSSDGIVEPVFVVAAEGRQGVGHKFKDRAIKKSSVEQSILDFLKDHTQTEIKFSSELTKKERVLVHNLSQKYHLKHKSFGKNEDRYLLVSKYQDGGIFKFSFPDL